MKRFARLADLRFLLSAAVVVTIVLVAILAPHIVSYEPNDQDLLNILMPPVFAGGSPEHLLGTDSLGRDTLSRLIYGARTAMTVAIFASTGAMLVGSFLANIAGYFGGRIDWAISRMVEIWLSFPPVVLSMLLIVGLGIGTDKVILAIILVDWTRFCRVLRTEVLVARRQDYVSFALLAGFSNSRVILKEVLPGIFPMLVTLFSLQMGISIVVEAILSFVSMGVPSDVPAWGQMIADARIDIYSAPWGVALPILTIFVAVLSFNVLGDSLNRVLDPRSKIAHSS